MSFVVIDSNVPIVANGRNTNASPDCREKALAALFKVIKSGGIVLDDAGEMMAEYRTYCLPKGEPGLGDRFFREILLNYSGKVKRIKLEKDDDGNFLDFPTDHDLNNFDRSDRKFAAAARKERVPVLNATDTDWHSHKAALRRNGIHIEFICGCAPESWFVGD